jgi:methyl-accepting chemotaxis protein
VKHLSTKIALVAGITAAVLMSALTVVIGVSVSGIFDEIQETERELLLGDYDQLIRTQVETAVSLLSYHHQRAQDGEVTMEEARRAAADALRELRYGEEGYFWADTTDGTNVVLLGRDSEGTNRFDLQDVNGKYLVQEIIEKGSQPGGGFTDYWFPKSEGGEAFPKRGYSLLFEPFGWVVGTGNYIDQIEAQLAELDATNQARLRRLIISMIVTSFVAVLVFFGVIFLLGRRLMRPLTHVSGALNQISEGAGDLTQRLSVESTDEVGQVAQSFDGFVGSLHVMITGIKESVGTLKDLGIDLAGNMNETAAAVNEITANIESVTRQVENQGGQVDSTASSVEELTRNIDALNEQVEREAATIERTAATIGEMLSGVESILHTSGSTRSQIGELRERIDSGNQAAEEMQAAVEQMTARSRSLQEANSFVVNIAAQTNLLAMNAAIEAAHAGDSGRGFSVVAEEIRKLADQASTQSKRIADEIKGMEADIETSVGRTDQTKQLLGKVNATIGEVEDVFAQLSREIEQQGEQGREIRGAMDELNEIAGAVQTGASEMSSANRQILQVVSGLSEATASMRSSMEEIVAGTREINTSVTNVNEMSNTNRETIEEIEHRVERFKT